MIVYRIGGERLCQMQSALKSVSVYSQKNASLYHQSQHFSAKETSNKAISYRIQGLASSFYYQVCARSRQVWMEEGINRFSHSINMQYFNMNTLQIIFCGGNLMENGLLSCNGSQKIIETRRQVCFDQEHESS